MSWLIRLYQIPVVKATLERMWRGGVAAVVSAYVLGSLVLNDLNVHTLEQVVGLFVGGAVTSLALALGISLKTKTGPAINKAEQITARPYHDPDADPHA